MRAFKIAETEAQFQSRVMEYASLRGWQWLHIQRAQNAQGYWRTPVQGLLGRGWPDLFMVREGKLLAAELKGDKTPLTSSQGAVLDLLHLAGVEVHIWRPEDWDRIMEILL